MRERLSLIIAAAILAVAFIIGILIFSATWRANNQANQTISVTGSAKQNLISDIGVLRVSITAQAVLPAEAYKQLIRQKPVVINYLKEMGFKEGDIKEYTITNYAIRRYNERGMEEGITGYNYSQRLEVQSSDVNKIKELSLSISSLVEQGVELNIEMPEYYYTALSDLKIKIQAEAAKDAMERATKIAEATGTKLGHMTGARMGVLQITPLNSNVISDYGINDASSIEKEITAVVSATFLIE